MLNKEDAQTVIDIKWVYANVYDFLATYAYSINALGLKRMLMAMSKKYNDDYECIKNKFVKLQDLIIYPTISKLNSELDEMPTGYDSIDALKVSPETFVAGIKFLITEIKECEEKNSNGINIAIGSMEHTYPSLFMKITKSTYDNEFWIGKLNKMEMLYDKYGWDAKFIQQDQKRIHDELKKEYF